MPRANGGWIYISNSEVPGVGTLVFDPDGTIVDFYTILSGTTFNCAGCVTPWQTWLSCEEFPNGQVWECAPYQPGEGLPCPTLGMIYELLLPEGV